MSVKETLAKIASSDSDDPAQAGSMLGPLFNMLFLLPPSLLDQTIKTAFPKGNVTAKVGTHHGKKAIQLIIEAP